MAPLYKSLKAQLKLLTPTHQISLYASQLLTIHRLIVIIIIIIRTIMIIIVI